MGEKEDEVATRGEQNVGHGVGSLFPQNWGDLSMEPLVVSLFCPRSAAV